MKIKITISDAVDGSGMVKVISDPDMKVLAAMAREKKADLSPAAGYALGALAKIITDSKANLQKQVQEKYEHGDIPMYDSNRRMFT